MRLRLDVVACLAFLAAPAFTQTIPRSAAEVLAFKRVNPCPSTGQRRGACPGHQVDHITPLCAGGPDRRENMQWLSVAQHIEKTRIDVRACRALKRSQP
jgi:5-methylcytosine-specific restriction endonuclease McrA